MRRPERSRRIAVFCGARAGSRREHLVLARDFGTALARHGLDLVYGAGGTGVMRAVADGVLEHGGGVTGVIPWALHDRDPAGRAPGAVFMVRSMHDRKALVYELASGFAVLPGGLDTLDELMEVATWSGLSLLDKPVVVLNHRGFYDPMLRMLDHLLAEGFLTPREHRLVQVAETVEEALALLGAGALSQAPVLEGI
ncbi:TIGR00730 family Rossman fold protein [Streptomyces palmae]|uniref:Cytokinin riboside 5'-monophosphate phosphoribohydrolase n=1 Tax=Streptomyces palmae TaxID=1701085 RepID=A0A4Z0H708_9ACTN|nr:TIGR00730 family Rossman fold protein [Streptomyces palmae]TGB07005.1 TIGR00730 family Rossman fold protein [Streptomyces palmae]